MNTTEQGSIVPAKTTTLIYPSELTPEQIKKAGAWVKMGTHLGLVEGQLQGRATAQITLLNVLPTRIESIATAETILKTAKKVQAEINETRLKETKPFNDFLARLMGPEKDMHIPVKEYENAIIALKKKKAEIDNAAQLKANEMQQYEMWLAQQVAASKAKHDTYIEERCAAALTHALGKPGEPTLIQVEGKEKYLEAVMAKFGTPDKFKHGIGAYEFRYNDFDTDKQAARVESLVAPPQQWASWFKEKLIAKFMDYDLAVQNKDIAIKRNEAEFNAEKLVITETAKNETVMAAIVGSATVAVIDENPTKALKKLWKLDMPDQVELILKIMVAYSLNWKKLEKHMGRINKIEAFSVKQMLTNLAKMKDEDEKFDFDGAIWREVEKL